MAMMNEAAAHEPLQGHEAASRFVELLTGYPGSIISWRLFPDDKAHRGSGINFDHTLDRLFEDFIERQVDGHGVFAVVNGGGHRDAHIETIRAVFVDADDSPLPDSWHVEPHFLIQRDETHWHAYWLTEGMTPAEFTEVQSRLAVHYGTDPTISNPSRVMRVPGFKHLKNPDDPQTVALVEMNTSPGGKQQRFTFEEVTAGLPNVPEYVTLARKLDPNRDKPVCELDLTHNVEEAERFLSRRDPAIQGEHGNHWTYETACMIRDIGISETLCVRMMLDSEWNERCEPPWNPEELETVVENAYRYGENRPGSKRAPLSRVREFANAKPMDLEGYETWRMEWLVERAAVASQPVPVNDDEAVPTDEDLFPAYLVGDLDSIPDPAWLIREVLPERSLGMHYGPTGSLKTFVELDKALWGAVGKTWAEGADYKLEGFKIARPLRTVIVAGEGARGIKRRIAAWAKRYGIATKDLPILVVPVMPRFALGSDVGKLIRTIKVKLPNPDHVVVDTAMWAAAGLNLNLPADSQTLLSSFKQVMQALDCSLTFVHHTGKDRSSGQLGAENLRAGVDIVDCSELVERSAGRRKIKHTNQKMKDAELRRRVDFEAYPETLWKDEDGRPVSSLVLRRCPGPEREDTDSGTNPLFELALKEIAAHKGKAPLTMNALAEGMARRYATQELTDGELMKSKEGMRNYLKRAVAGELASYARKTGKAKNALWMFELRQK